MARNNKPHPQGIDNWVNALIDKGFVGLDGVCIRGPKYTRKGRPKEGMFKFNNDGGNLGRQLKVDAHFGLIGHYTVFLTPRHGYYKPLQRYLRKNYP